MTAPITVHEIRRTAAHRLARHLAFDYPLRIQDVEDIVDQALAAAADFMPSEDDPSLYEYRGDGWAVEYGTGRPRLVEAITVGPHPIGPATARAERAFALIVEMVDCVGPPMSQECIDRLRRESWRDRFRRAAERDVTDELLDRIYGTGCDDEATSGKDVTDDAKE